MYMTAEGKALKEVYQWEILSQWKGKPLEGDLDVELIFFHGDLRERDTDNFNKLVLDAMSGRVYHDDKQITDLHTRKRYDKENPRIEINITPL